MLEVKKTQASQNLAQRCLCFLFFDINRNTGLEVYGEVVLENGDLLDQAADQRLIKLVDGAGLLFDEILQFPDLFHLLILDDAVHLGLPALIP